MDGLPTKRARVSHYRKPEPSYARPADNAQRRPATDSRDASNMNPRSREPTPSAPPLPVVPNGHDKRQYSDEENDVANRKRACDSHNSISYAVSREKTVKENSICNSPNKITTQEEFRAKEAPLERTTIHNSRSRQEEREKEREREREKERTRWNKVSSTTHNGNSVSRVSPDSQADRILPVDSRPPTTVESKSEFPDYLT